MILLAVAAAVSLALVLGALWGLYGRFGDRTEGFVLAAGGGGTHVLRRVRIDCARSVLSR